MTKRVIYTEAYDINWDPYKGRQEWQTVSLDLKKRYAGACGADLIILDNSTGFAEIFKDIVFLDGSNRLETATLSSIYAMNDFINSPYEEFLWMDLDFVCLKFEDLFKFGGPAIHIKCFQKDTQFLDWLDTDKKEFYFKHIKSDYFYQVNSGKYRLNKFWAKEIISFLNKIQWNPLNSRAFSDKIDGGFTLTDDTLLNVFFGLIAPNKMFMEPFYEPYNVYPDNFLHFPSKTKIFLPEYIRKNPVNY